MKTYAPGTRIGQYEIASRPMIGGMGVVYFFVSQDLLHYVGLLGKGKLAQATAHP